VDGGITSGPTRQSVTGDAVAGLPGVINSVPDGIAARVLTGVNPVFGLNARAVRADRRWVDPTRG
jgi:hypothetical protein